MASLEFLLEGVVGTREGFKCDCPNCGGKGKFWFSTEKGLGCCFHNGCDWYYERRGVNEHQLRKFLGSSDEATYRPRPKETKTGDTKLPEEFESLIYTDSKECKDVLLYLKSRGLTVKAIRDAGVGYCSSGRFAGYIVFPVFDEDGEVVYWQGRQYKKRKSKFYNPASTKKSELLYRIGSRKPSKAVLVESVINALTLYAGGNLSTWAIFVLLGSSLSEEQLKKLMSYEVKQIVVALDGDAWQKAVDMAKELSRVCGLVKLVRVPNGEDLNSLGRETAWDLIHGQTIIYRARDHHRLLEGDFRA